MYRVLKLFFFGGLVSLIFALFLFEITAASEWFGAMAAGPVEELAKLLAVVFVANQWKNMRWTLNGMLLGAAVGGVLGFLLKSLILDVIGWLLVLMLIQSDLGQVKNAIV